MKKIASDALITINRLLGIGGGSGQGETLLDDGNLAQTLPIIDALRRARAGGVGDGWFYGVLQNVHAGAGILTSSVDPYDPAELIPLVSSYPDPVPRDLDIHLIAVGANRTSGTGALDGGVLFVNFTAGLQGWGADDGGSLVTVVASAGLVLFTGLNTTVSTFVPAVTGDGSIFQSLNIRIPRGMTLNFRTDAAAAATYRLAIVLGLFPASLGQDIAS